MIIHQVGFHPVIVKISKEESVSSDWSLKLLKYFSLAAACWFFLLNLVWLLSSTFRYSVEENGDYDNS